MSLEADWIQCTPENIQRLIQALENENFSEMANILDTMIIGGVRSVKIKDFQIIAQAIIDGIHKQAIIDSIHKSARIPMEN